MMRMHRWLICLLLVLGLNATAEAYRFRPPVPPNVEVSVGTNEWAVEAEAFSATGQCETATDQCLSPWEIVSDTSASGERYLRLGGNTDYKHQVCLTTDFCTSGSCYVWLRARAPASNNEPNT
jgi:hypothetical protein